MDNFWIFINIPLKHSSRILNTTFKGRKAFVLDYKWVNRTLRMVSTSVGVFFTIAIPSSFTFLNNLEKVEYMNFP